MTVKFPKNKQEVNAYRQTMGHARFDGYMTACNGDEMAAMRLYLWNARISQAFYLPLQIWEVTLRNRMNNFLCWKFKGNWPYRDLRLAHKDFERLESAKKRQEDARNLTQAGTDAIVADISAGFWVSMLTSRSNARYAWQNNLLRIFPDAPREWRDPNSKSVKWGHTKPYQLCDTLLGLRNRVAHHEPIYAMKLEEIHEAANVVIRAMCPASSAYFISHCTVQTVLSEKP